MQKGRKHTEQQPHKAQVKENCLLIYYDSLHPILQRKEVGPCLRFQDQQRCCRQNRSINKFRVIAYKHTDAIAYDESMFGS